jgi:hypothetical protein
MEFAPLNRQVAGSIEAELYSISPNFDDHDFDIVAQEHSFTGFAAKNQHLITLLVRSRFQ